MERWREEESGVHLFNRITQGACVDAQLRLPVLERPIRAKSLLQVAGASNVGKTQYLLALCVECILPRTLGGQELCALFVDTETKFCGYRIMSIVENRLNRAVEEYPQAELKVNNDLIKSCLSRFYLLSCDSVEKFKEIFDELDFFVARNRRIFLMAIDNICAFCNEERGSYRKTIEPSLLRLSAFISEHFMVTAVAQTLYYKNLETEPAPVDMMPVCWQYLVTDSILLERGGRTANSILRTDKQDQVFVMRVTGSGIIGNKLEAFQ